MLPPWRDAIIRRHSITHGRRHDFGPAARPCWRKQPMLGTAVWCVRALPRGRRALARTSMPTSVNGKIELFGRLFGGRRVPSTSRNQVTERPFNVGGCRHLHRSQAARSGAGDVRGHVVEKQYPLGRYAHVGHHCLEGRYLRLSSADFVRDIYLAKACKQIREAYRPVSLMYKVRIGKHVERQFLLSVRQDAADTGHLANEDLVPA